MPIVSALLLLPVPIRDEVDADLRASGYGDALRIATWLRARGYDIGKSAVHRYAIRLRSADSSLGAVHARVGQYASRLPASASHAATVRELLLELRQMAARQAEIAGTLASLGTRQAARPPVTNRAR